MTERATYLSSSRVQQDAESVILDAASELLGCGPLTPRRVTLSNGVHVEVDGVSADEGVFAEAYARQGALRGAQLKKIAQDILKLAMARRVRGEVDVVIVFASQEAHDSIRGWLRHAADSFGVRLLVVDIAEEWREKIRKAQRGQIMVNLNVDEVADDVDALATSAEVDA